MIGGFRLGGRDVSARLEQAPVIEPTPPSRWRIRRLQHCAKGRAPATPSAVSAARSCSGQLPPPPGAAAARPCAPHRPGSSLPTPAGSRIAGSRPATPGPMICPDQPGTRHGCGQHGCGKWTRRSAKCGRSARPRRRPDDRRWTPFMTSTGGRAPPSQNTPLPGAESHWPGAVRGSPAYGRQDAPPRSGQADTRSGEHPVRRTRRPETASRKSPGVRPVMASFAPPFLCVSGVIRCPAASCQGDRCPYACMLQRADTEADGSAPRQRRPHP
jgi:hypothetical protein